VPETSHPTPGVLLRLLKGLVPIAVMLAIVYAPGARMRSTLEHFAVLILCAICFGLGRRWLKATLLTKWIGFCFAAWVIVSLALLPFVSVTLPPFFFLLLPFAAYDLFVAQPWKGRFARARAQRRGFPG
jgi:uncharacterized membrane protein